MNLSEKLFANGQSIWYDNVDRRLLDSGELAAMIQNKEIFGLTSNPSIFEKSMVGTSTYDDSLQAMAWAGLSGEQIYLELVKEDIQRTADLFKGLYEASDGGDGYVSLEVSPLLAHDTERTIAEAKALWASVGRKNLMVKVPATLEGLPAIRALIGEGININATLIFSIERYKQVMEAFIQGLEDRVNRHEPVDRIHSVASFFISRIDTAVDKLLESVRQAEPNGASLVEDLMGKTAIAYAQQAYQAFLRVFQSERFEALAKYGAHMQRPLWASTGTKNPNYSDVVYVENLVARNSVNTVPPATLKALLDHTGTEVVIENDLERSAEILRHLERFGIDMQSVTTELERDGVEKFAQAYKTMIDSIESKRLSFAGELAGLREGVHATLKLAAEEVMVTRLFEHDPTLWTYNLAAHEEIRNRLGWLTLPEKQAALVPGLEAFRDECLKAGLKHVFVLGMGGSSLAPEVMSLAFGPDIPEDSGLSLQIIDTTNPDEILMREKSVSLKETLFIVSSKSGGTSETLSAFKYFWQKLEVELGDEAGRHFVAITDPSTSLEKLAKEKNFLKVFNAPPDVGGRYSVFTQFGLVPAALMGIGVQKLLRKADLAAQVGRPGMPYGANPNLMLGLVLGEAALAGKNKLSFITDELGQPLVPWLEQLIAESSGKEGKGILPIESEPLLESLDYSKDRVFVYLSSDGSQSALVNALKEKGFPVITLKLETAYDLGREFYRWEYATAIACAVLHVNAFDQPNVQDNKTITKNKISEYQALGFLKEGKPIWEDDSFAIFGKPMDGLESAGCCPEVLARYLNLLPEHGYIVLSAYLARTEQFAQKLQSLRARILQKTKLATTLGFGPRFLHSTGQLHKGGFAGGLFLILTADPVQDVEIPGEGMSFGTLQKAQALGDLDALLQRDKVALRIHIKSGTDLSNIF